MKIKIGLKEVVAIGIGTALFVALTEIQIPLGVVDDIAFHPRMAVLAFFSAVFGPITGAVIGFLGHALGDALFYNSIKWCWVFPEIIVGAGIGFFADRFAVEKGGFDKKNLALFNVAQIVSNAAAWLICAPVLNIVFKKESSGLVFSQGAFAFIVDIIVIGVLGSIFLMVYSNINGKSS